MACSRLLIGTAGTMGDVLPSVPIARLALSHGLRPLVLASESHEALLRGAGIDVAIYPSAHPTARPPMMLGGGQSAAMSWIAKRILLPAIGHLDALCSRISRSGDVVVAVSYAVGALQAATRSGLPAAHLALSPSQATPNGQLWRLGNALAALSAHRAKPHERSPTPNFPTIGLFPEWFAEAATEDLRHVLCTGFPLADLADPFPKKIADRQDETRKRVAVFFGSHDWHVRDLEAALVAALNKYGAIGLVVGPVGGPLDHPLVPIGACSLSALLPQCDAIIHHGGIGTIAHAVRAGIPQLCIPAHAEAESNARAAEALGIATICRRSEVTNESLDRGFCEILHSQSLKLPCEVHGRLVRQANHFDSLWEKIEKLNGLT